jgi:hypothetical protein
MAFKAYDLMIAVSSPDPDPCSEFTLGGPPCPAFSEIPPAPNTPHCPDSPCPAASLGGPPDSGDTSEGALAALQIQLRKTLRRTQQEKAGSTSKSLIPTSYDHLSTRRVRPVYNT